MKQLLALVFIVLLLLFTAAGSTLYLSGEPPLPPTSDPLTLYMRLAGLTYT